jgi:hypothetical protein
MENKMEIPFVVLCGSFVELCVIIVFKFRRVTQRNLVIVGHPFLFKKNNSRHPERSEGSAGHLNFQLVIGSEAKDLPAI